MVVSVDIREAVGDRGRESGPGARPMDPNWVLEIRDQCLDGRVPFFFKQWGGTRKKKA